MSLTGVQNSKVVYERYIEFRTECLDVTEILLKVALNTIHNPTTYLPIPYIQIKFLFGYLLYCAL